MDKKIAKLPKLFSLSNVGNTLCLKASTEISDASWGAWFGEIQHVLRVREWNEDPFDSCDIDFRECEWIDPLPLLSLAIALAEFEKDGGTVSASFPDCSHPKHHRLLKYLAKEGFLTLLQQNAAGAINFPLIHGISQIDQDLGNKLYRDISIGNMDLTNDLIDYLKELPINLIFEECTCLPVKLLHFETSDFDRILKQIDDYIEEILFQPIGSVIKSKVPNWAQSGLTYRLQMFLRETIHNTVEHAYKKSGFTAIYIRYRDGALGAVPKIWRKINEILTREDNERIAPKLQRAFADQRTGFFEIFVLDAGCGLCNTLKNDFNLTKSMKEVFYDGRSRKTNRPTQFGGLHLVRELLEIVREYVRVKDADDWWGTEISVLPPKQYYHAKAPRKAFGVDSCGYSVKGLTPTPILKPPVDRFKVESAVLFYSDC